jgi:hypothetical protein
VWAYNVRRRWDIAIRCDNALGLLLKLRLLSDGDLLSSWMVSINILKKGFVSCCYCPVTLHRVCRMAWCLHTGYLPSPPIPHPVPDPTTEMISPIMFRRDVLSMLTNFVPCVFWWRMCLTGGNSELCMVLFSFQVSELLTAFRPAGSNQRGQSSVLLREFDSGAKRELWDRQRHWRSLKAWVPL